MNQVRVIVVNVVYSNPKPVTKRILRELRDKYTVRHENVVWLLVETKRGRVRRWLGHGWHTRQGWKVTGRENNAVAWDMDMGHRGRESRWSILTWPLGHAILPRWMNTVVLQWWAWTVLHQPPTRDNALVPAAMGRLSRLHGELVKQGLSTTYGGDKNAAPMKTWAQDRGLNYREAGVMFVATSLQVHRFEAVTVPELDHRVLIVDLG